MPVCGRGIHAEDHLPRTVRLMQAGIVIHGVCQIGGVGHESVDERDQTPVMGTVGGIGGTTIGYIGRISGIGGNDVTVPPIIDHQPEAVRIHRETVAQRVGARGFRGGETCGLDRCNGGQIIHRGMSNQHDALLIVMVLVIPAFRPARGQPRLEPCLLMPPLWPVALNGIADPTRPRTCGNPLAPPRFLSKSATTGLRLVGFAGLPDVRVFFLVMGNDGTHRSGVAPSSVRSANSADFANSAEPAEQNPQIPQNLPPPVNHMREPQVNHPRDRNHHHEHGVEPCDRQMAVAHARQHRSQRHTQIDAHIVGAVRQSAALAPRDHHGLRLRHRAHQTVASRHADAGAEQIPVVRHAAEERQACQHRD